MTQTPNHAEFVKLLTSHQRRLYGYIGTLLPSPADTEEVLQQTNAVLWAKADEFELGTSFRAWSFRIAYLEVMTYHRNASRQRKLFSSELVETMAAERSNTESIGDRSSQALRSCLEKLSAGDRELVTRRYGGTNSSGEPMSVPSLAEGLGRSVSSVYRSLDRIRQALLECVQRTLSAEEHS